MNKFRRVVLSSCLVLASSALISPGLGHASSAKATAPNLVSGATPLPPAEPGEGIHNHPSDTGHCGSDAAHQNWELDNSIAANPANNANLVAAWIQDWADAIVVGYSTDTGKTWNRSIPQTSGCTLRPGPWGEPVPDFVTALSEHTSAFDPWLSFGPPSVGTPQGTVYLTSTVQGEGKYAVIANRSTDGGATWADPVVLESTAYPDTDGLDTSYVIADPARPGHAYAAWTKGDFVGATRKQQVSRTTDGGETWSTPTSIPSDQLQYSGQLLILPNGTLVNVAAEVPPQTSGVAVGALNQVSNEVSNEVVPEETPEVIHLGSPPLMANWFVGPTTVVARRLLTEDGETWSWSSPVRIAVADPIHVTGARSAMAPDGTIYVSWLIVHDSPTGPSSSLMYSKSADGGLTWSPTGAGCGSQPLPDALPPQGCVGESIQGPPMTGTRNLTSGPSLAVADDGTVGVMFYDHRNDAPPQDPPKDTDVWLRHSHDGGQNWMEDHLAGPFDKTSAPKDGPGAVGDYHGITAAAGGFATTFSLAEPLPGANFTLEAKPTDIFFSRLPRGQISR